jgi:uncharacterized protein (UPF0332 family)
MSKVKIKEKAEDAVEVAQESFSNSHYPDGVSKAYYVMFYWNKNTG